LISSWSRLPLFSQKSRMNLRFVLIYLKKFDTSHYIIWKISIGGGRWSYSIAGIEVSSQAQYTNELH
jgi:hypothetical protein